MYNKNKSIGWLENVEVTVKIPFLVIFIFYIILMMAVAFLAGFFFFLYFSGDKPTNIAGNSSNWTYADLPDCSNMSLVNTSKCLNDFVNEVYNYIETEDSITLSYNDLFNVGGDCKDWNVDFYQREMEKYGFDTKVEEVYIREEVENGTTYHVFHAFTIASDYSGYCLLDLQSLNCATYSFDEEILEEENEN